MDGNDGSKAFLFSLRFGKDLLDLKLEGDLPH
jgi:hypothetical protein